MAEALAGGMMAQGIIKASQICLTDTCQDRKQLMHDRWGVNIISTNAEAIENAEIIVFAVKPQVLVPVLSELRNAVPRDAMVLSVVAGAKIDQFIRLLNHDKVIRCMPNTPCLVGEGMTMWTCSEAVTERQQQQARAILGACGEEEQTADEGFLDIATAVSGSGPAYFFLMIEAMTDAGVQMGMSREVAQRMVMQTMLGSVKYAMDSGRCPSSLRHDITSPGGTTAAALRAAESGGYRAIMSDMMWAAHDRSVQLGAATPQEHALEERLLEEQRMLSLNNNKKEKLVVAEVATSEEEGGVVTQQQQEHAQQHAMTI